MMIMIKLMMRGVLLIQLQSIAICTLCFIFWEQKRTLDATAKWNKAFREMELYHAKVEKH